MATVTETKGQTAWPSSKPGKKASSARSSREIPEALIYEMDNGVPIYYRGYKEVLTGTKPPDALTGSTLIQSYAVTGLLKFLFSKLPETHYEILGKKLGLQLAHNSRRVCDIAVYLKTALAEVEHSGGYALIPPKIVIEVDTKADVENLESEPPYFHRKTGQLLGFGVEKLIRIYTREPRKIMVAAPNADWRITDWTSEIELLPGVSFRLSDLVKK